VATTCEFRPEYACYQRATCERQPDGTCGFTPTPELTKCLGGSTPGPGGCDFKGSYEYGAIGGLRITVDRAFLKPGNSYQYTRSPVRGDGPTRSCTPLMPPCGAQGVISAHDIETSGLQNADVQAALAQPTPPLFGRDLRPVDGTVLELKRHDGRGLLIGADCPATFSSCRAIPPGVARLRDLLLALDKQQLATPECAAAGF
jgi:hypothetical protein